MLLISAGLASGLSKLFKNGEIFVKFKPYSGIKEKALKGKD